MVAIPDPNVFKIKKQPAVARPAGDAKNQFPFTAPIVPGTGQPQDNGTPPSPGYTPDYTSLIQGDPLYQQTGVNMAAQGVQSAADRKTGIAQALAQFGEVPDFSSLGLSPDSPLYQALMSDVTPDVRQSANDLTGAGLSTVAGLQRQHTKNVGDLVDSLAARGALQSGATGVGLNQEDQAYAGSQYTARTSLLQYLAGLQQAFAQSEATRQNTLAGAAQDATQRQIQLNPAVAPTEGAGSFAPGYAPPPSAQQNLAGGLISSLNLPQKVSGSFGLTPPASGYSQKSNANLH